MSREVQDAMYTTGVPMEKALWNAHLEEVPFKPSLEVNLGFRNKKVFRLKESHGVHEMQDHSNPRI